MCYIHCHLHFSLLVIKLILFKKGEITPSLKENDRLKFAQEVAINHIKQKVKTQFKLSYKVFKKQDVYDTFITIYSFTTLIQLKYFLGGIQHYVTVVGKCTFDNNFPVEHPLNRDKVDYCCANDNKTRGTNGYKGALNSIRFSQ